MDNQGSVQNKLVGGVFFKGNGVFLQKRKEKKTEGLKIRIINLSPAPLRSAIRYTVTWDGEVGVESGMRVGSGQADLLCITNVS